MSLWSYQSPRELSDEQYARWKTLLEERTGICFSSHKSILQKGLSQRMREVAVDDYEQYFQQVSSQPSGAVEWTQLVDKVSVKETSFFREPLSFDAVRNYLTGRLSDKSKPREYTLDIWSVGCSTGEEAYSLAILANEIVESVGATVYVGVMATDISQSALNVARRGHYAQRKVEAMSEPLRRKYFAPSGGNQGYQVASELHHQLCFVQGNMLDLAKVPRMTMDVIFCQNVLVYFRRDRQRAVLNNLVEHLKPGGLLVVGPGEVSGWQHSKMRRADDEKVQVYVKKTSSV
jgi:type IV pilus assembly protein PilK